MLNSSRPPVFLARYSASAVTTSSANATVVVISISKCFILIASQG